MLVFSEKGLTRVSKEGWPLVRRALQKPDKRFGFWCEGPYKNLIRGLVFGEKGFITGLAFDEKSLTRT